MHLGLPDCYTRVIHMVLSMSRPTKHSRTGIYWLRRRVPADLVEKLGRKEVTKSLRTRDPDEAKRKHAEMLIELDAQWSRLREVARPITDREAHLFAKDIGDEWFEKHRENPSEQLLWHIELYEGMWSRYPLPETKPIVGVDGIADPVPGTIPVENVFWKSMRRRCLEAARQILDAHGFSDDPWSLHKTAKAVGAALQRASVELARLEHGGFATSSAANPSPWCQNGSDHSAALPTVARNRRIDREAADSLTNLVESWWQESQAAGRKRSTYESYRNTVANFVRFLGHDDSSRISAKDVIAFKDHRLSTPSPKTGKVPSAKTVKDSDLSALKAVFDWAMRNGRVASNPAAGITIKLGKPQRLRSKGFTDEEAVVILRAADTVDQGRDSFKTFSAKRWVPWLCAFTGARVGELVQLRKQDVFEWSDGWAIRITPEAGTTKTNEAREVPLHHQLVEKGFTQFVRGAAAGHLFLNVHADASPLGPLRGVKNRLAEFAREVISDPNVAPNHGWRHRFKTIGMEAGIPPRILDAIQGQAARSVADSYGEVTLRTMVREVAKLPRYEL